MTVAFATRLKWAWCRINVTDRRITCRSSFCVCVGFFPQPVDICSQSVGYYTTCWPGDISQHFLKYFLGRLGPGLGARTGRVHCILCHSGLLASSRQSKLKKQSEMEFPQRRRSNLRSKNYPCGVCGLGCCNNSIECSKCHSWIHRWVT